VPLLRNDDTLVKLSKWGEGYLLSLPCAVNFIKKVYEIGINKHSDTWIRDNIKQITVDRIKYSLVIPPNAGNIYNTLQVNNKVDFSYPHSKNNTSPLGSRIGLKLDEKNGNFEFVEPDPENALFASREDLNLTKVASRLEGKLAEFSC